MLELVALNMSNVKKITDDLRITDLQREPKRIILKYNSQP